MNVLRMVGLGVVLAVMGSGLAMAQDAAARPDQKIKTKSNIKNDRMANSQGKTPNKGDAMRAETGANKTKSNVKNNVAPPVDAAKVKSHSNQSNNRMAGGAGSGTAQDNKVKSHSNQSNNRMAGGAGSGTAQDNKIKSHSNSTNNRMAGGAGSGAAQDNKIKSHSNSTNNKAASGGTTPAPVDGAKIKSHSNSTNN